MINVWHIGHGHRYDDTRIVKKECASLAATGEYSVTYITSDKWCKNVENVPKCIDGVNIRIVQQLDTRRERRFINYLNTIKKMIYDNKEDIEIVHIHEFILWPICTFCKKNGIKVILDMHEDDANDIPEKMKGRYGAFIASIISHIVRKYEKKITSKVDAVVSVTPNIIRRVQDNNKNTEMIANFPIVTSEEVSRTFSEFKNNIKNLGFAGGISPLWSHKEIISLLDKFDDVEYYMAGPTTEEYLSELRSEVAWKKCHYLGLIKRNEVDDLYKKIGIGMALAKKSSFSKELKKGGTLGNTKLFEFMEQAIPVICTDFTIWSDIVKEYDVGICIDETDSNAIFNAIAYLIDNPMRAYEMGQNGRRAVLEKYNWSIDSKKLLNLYENLVNCK